MRCFRAIFSLAAGLALVALLCGCGQDGPPGNGAASSPREVDVVRAEPRDVVTSREFPGTVAARRTVDIRARVDGWVLERHFAEGAIVEDGQLLFTIEPQSLDDSLKAARAQLKSDQASLSLAKREYERFKELVESGAVSRNQFDKAKTAFEEAQQAVQRSKANVRQASTQFSYTEVRAPFTGRIGRADVNVGALVSSAERTRLATISTLDPMYVDFSLPDELLLVFQKRAIAQGRAFDEKDPQQRAVNIRLLLGDGTPYPHPGEFDMANRAIDNRTASLKARGVVPNPEAALLPGQYVRVRLPVGRLSGAIVVPEEALFFLQSKPMVWVVDGQGKARRAGVVPGETVAAGRIIKQGLAEGALVVVSGTTGLRPGEAVKTKVVQAKKSGADGDSAPPASANATAKASSNATSGS
ncbi:efflux RND transporter periplasmic adaptor subunit [Desulfohalovibrio reitneri]|uniref:efflux RND transporter periplasmic adaptor subunit n=1 Tax=Desulfohalovibrio reitneri TaxID=1307759 RepID=UPI00068B3CF4|nr:efflux RND transporter periplasmic adaptor subunit [Desulfohalovibrio reitneri]